MPLDNKISNILGVRIPEWLYQQLQTRSAQNSKSYRDNNNLIYLANKTAWIRLVSSVNIIQSGDLNYFRGLGADVLSGENSLAQQFTLFGGTTTYLNNKNNLRAGLGKGGSYGLLGESEIQKYGYRPMPGITSVNIETKGRLGSVREATINFKCWDKDQLDIVDALYFKLGYSMFLEWGHTYYYPSAGDAANPSKYDPTKVLSTEFYTIDPFESGLNKEEIFRRISKNSRDSEGNYDAMLGIVTNFNFSYNQEGSYDCQIKLAALGALGDSIKINNPSNLPNILEESIKQFNSVLDKIAKDKKAKEEAERKAREEAEQNKNDNLKNRTLSEIIADTPYQLRNYSYASNVKPNNVNLADATLKEDKYGQLFIIRRLNGFIPTEDDLLKTVGFKLDTVKLSKLFTEYKLQFSDINSWELENEAGVLDILTSSFDEESFGLIDEFSSEKSFFENYKVFIKNVPIIRILNNIAKINNPRELAKLSANETIQNSFLTLKTNKKYTNEYDRNLTYDISIKRKYFAKSTNPDAVTKYTIVGANDYFSNIGFEGTEGFFRYLQNNNISVSSFKLLDVFYNGKTGVEFVFTFNVPITKKSDIKQKKSSISLGEEEYEIVPQQDVVYNVETEIRIQDTYLISSFTSFSKDGVSVDQPINFLSYEKQLEDQNQGEAQEEQNLGQDPSSEQTRSPLSFLSSFELMLRTIQVHSLSEAINTNDLDLGRSVQKIEFYKTKTANDKLFIEQVFSNGIFTPFIDQLISGSIDDTNYDEISNQNSDYRFKVQSKYGFSTNLMANREKLYQNPTTLNFTPVDYKKLLTSYVVPYNISQEIELGTTLNHPVYISFGTLLMILNHSCTLYDVNEDGSIQKPIIYIDFNPDSNFCLSNPNQLSTDPWTCLIPFEGENNDYRDLFEDVILTNDRNAIQPLSDSKQSTPLFTPKNENLKANRDNLSASILPFKYDNGTITNPYRGKIMNILINIDYLMDTVKSFTTKNDENKVFLKPFLEQVLIDISKSIGNFNIFRLSYNDGGNTYQITDDQIVPPPGNEKLLELNGDNLSLPLFGKTSIAKSIDIKTEMSNKLNSMLAISANADTEKKSTLSTNGDTVGYINTNYVDRYIPNRKEPGILTLVDFQKLSPEKQKKFADSKGVTVEQLIKSLEDKKMQQEKYEESISDGLKNLSIQFNSAIESFYNSISPSQQYVSTATNYFIKKLTSIKGKDEATRASAMIPVSINFTTDGISGFYMGQGFTVPNEMLPYTYSTRLIGREENYINKIGFVVTGLSHTIENNSWNTAVKASMIFLKDSTKYQTKNKYEKQTAGQFSLGVDTPLNQDIPRAGVGGRSVVPGSALQEPGFIQKLDTVARNIGTTAENLKRVMQAESGLNPQAVNSNGGATGLIQFMPKTAISLGTTTENLRNMTGVQQLDFVEKYYKNLGAKPGRNYDVTALYAFTFLPAMVSKLSNDSFILSFPGLSAEIISQYNPAIARAAGKNPGDPLTVRDFKIYVSKIA